MNEIEQVTIDLAAYDHAIEAILERATNLELGGSIATANRMRLIADELRERRNPLCLLLEMIGGEIRLNQ